MARDERRDPGEMYPGGKTYGKPGEAPDRAVSWKSVVDKPTTYPPEKHRHDTSEVDGLNDSLEQCVRKVEGKGLSTCDYTQAEKAKLSRVEDGANKTIIDASLSTSSAAADAKAVGDKIADCMTKVTTLKINDEWRFSLATGLSGALAIRLEHLDFPMQGIWGVYTEMSIPTGLGTLATKNDIPSIPAIPEVVAPSSSAAGKAADAKEVYEALKGKLDWVTSGQGATLGFADDFMSFSNSYGSNSIFFPNRVVDPEKDSELAHDGIEIFATRVWINWFLKQDETKAALFSGKGFEQAVKKAGGFQHDENGYYIEVEEA